MTIDSALTGSGTDLAVDDPSTGERLATIASASAADVERAVEAASDRAQTWRREPSAARAALCHRIAAAIEADGDRLTDLNVRNAGLPVSVARRDVAAAARYFTYYASVAETLDGRSLQTDTGALAVTRLVPWGVCAIILPFNLPCQLTARDLAPALAMGNAVVLKAPEQTPLPVIALAELCWEAGVPREVVSVVAGGADTGASLVDDPRVSHVTFTGSHRAGRAVMEAAARRIIPSVIELGGKSPHVVFADADLTRVAEVVVATSMPTAGQACSAGTRVLAESGCLDELREALGLALGRLNVGPAADDPDVGPVISATQRDAVARAIDLAVSDGARLVCGGSTPPDGVPAAGHYVRPTLVETSDSASQIAQEEVFGPVVTLMGFDGEADAIALANGTPYGLVAGVWTRDLERALRVAEAIDAGQVHLNGYAVGGGAGVPFGGMKRSGVGRVKGKEGALQYVQTKTFVFPDGR